MTRQAEQISEGNYEGQIEVLDKDEVGRLILSFNQMTKNLKAEKEQVEKLENMRRDFVSNVTHELKTPLTSIRGFVETLKEGAIEDEEVAMRFLSIIDIEAERLGNLIEDILLLSEIESGTDTRMSLVEVEPMIDQVIELLNQSKKENVILKKESKGHVAPFYCNEDRLRELIINLADNGVKYTNEGSVTIECRQEENMLVLEFSDTGVGIPKEHLPRLFERFYRVDKGRSRKQGGTGLGLSIVKHIVELYKGTISVESEPGVGSTFTVRLPYDERS
jgi:two-component system phosphate regulon sensor histidine kinase PhoR